MNTQKRVNKMMFSSERVELRNLNELEKRYNSLSSALNKADKSWRSYQDYLTRAEGPFDQMMQKRQDLADEMLPTQSALNAFKKAGDELGVEVTNIQQYRDLQNLENEIQQVLGIIDSFGDPAQLN